MSLALACKYLFFLDDKGNRNGFLVCIWGLFNVWMCLLVSLCQCASVTLYAEQPRGLQNKTHASKDTTVSSLSSVRFEDPLRQTEASFLTHGWNKSGPPWGQSRGPYIALELFQLCLLVGKTCSAAVPLMLTRCCQSDGPQTDIPVNKTRLHPQTWMHKHTYTHVGHSHSHSCECSDTET